MIDYILQDTSHTPLIIFGEMGTGKATVIAKSATEIYRRWLEAKPEQSAPYVILRFCGVTPQSSTARHLLQSMCHQIAYVKKDLRQSVPVDYKRAVSYFRGFLQNCDSSQRIVIFINDVDSTIIKDAKSVFDWLPARLSDHAKIIISTRVYSDQEKNDGVNIHQKLQPLSVEKCIEILQKKLEKCDRKLTDDQTKIAEEVFGKCSLPLFVQYTLEEVLNWKSYMQYSARDLASCVDECITKMFKRMEKKYGKHLVGKVASYITASREGISETELEHVCSLDDKLLNAVFEFSHPPIRRLPSMLLLRIKHDMDIHLNERNVDDINVMWWRYQPFAHTARRLYLNDTRHEIHWNMADYYTGEWSHNAKTYRYREQDSSALRYVPKQPLVFSSDDEQVKTTVIEKFNIRKLNQMPFHLAEAGRLLTLNSEVFFNYKWICTKLRACSIQKIVADYDLVQGRKDVSAVADAIRMSEAAVANNPEVIGVELTGRLLNLFKTSSDIRQLIKQCDDQAKEKCAVIPNWQVYQFPGGPLQYVCEVDTNITGSKDVELIENYESIYLTAKPYNSNQMCLWDITQGESMEDVELPTESTVHATPNGKLVHVVERKKFLVTYRFDETFHSGLDPQSRIEFGHIDIEHVTTSNKYVAITKRKPGKGLVVIDFANPLNPLNPLQYEASMVIFSQDESFLLTHDSVSLCLLSLPDMRLRSSITVDARPIKMLFTSQSSDFYVLDEKFRLNSYKVSFESGTDSSAGVIHDKNLQDFVFSNAETKVLVQAARCLYLFDTQTNRLLHRIDKMPPGGFKESNTNFKTARFDSSDTIVIATRHTYIATWCAETGNPQHIFQTSVSPIISFHTFKNQDLAVSIHGDFSIHVWNIGKISADVQWDGVLKCELKCMSTSENCEKIVCCGVRFPEAIVLDVTSMKQLCTVEHSEDPSETIIDVKMSPAGNYIVTRMYNTDKGEDTQSWSLLRNDKIWNATSGRFRFEISSSRYVNFSKNGTHLWCIRCRQYKLDDWSLLKYDLLIFPFGSIREQNDLPLGDVIGQPVTTAHSGYLCFLLQMPSDDHFSSKTSDKKRHTIGLFAYDFDDKRKNVQRLYIDFQGESKKPLIPIEIDALLANNLLIMVGSSENGYITHNPDGSLYLGDVRSSECLVVSFENQTVLQRYSTSVQQMPVKPSISSRRHTFTMDNEGQIYNNEKRDVINTIDMSHVAKNGVVFLLDGKYAAILLNNRNEMIVVSTETGHHEGHLYIHGHALHVSTAVNDQTLVVGCRDSRILVFSIVLGLEEPLLNHYIGNLLSRRLSHTPDVSHSETTKVSSSTCLSRYTGSYRNDDSALKTSLKDVGKDENKYSSLKPRDSSFSSVESVLNDKMKEINTKSKIELQKEKIPNSKAHKFQTVAKMVKLTQKSMLCCIQ